MSKLTVNIFYPVFLITGVILCYEGSVPWETFILIIMSTTKMEISRKDNK